MQNELLDIWERDRKTVMFVTHSVEEAVFLVRPGRGADEVARPHHARSSGSTCRARACAPNCCSTARYQDYVVDIERLMDEQIEEIALMARLTAIPGLSAADRLRRRCCSLWDRCRARFDGQRPAARALGRCSEVPIILTDKESLLQHPGVVAPHGDRLLSWRLRSRCPRRPADGAHRGWSRRSSIRCSMIIYPVPKAALMPLIMLWLGVGEMSEDRW